MVGYLIPGNGQTEEVILITLIDDNNVTRFDSSILQKQYDNVLVLVLKVAISDTFQNL